MGNFEGMPSVSKQEESQKEKLSKLVNSLLADSLLVVAGSSKEDIIAGEKVLDEKMAKMTREDLLNLTMEIQQYLNEPNPDFVDESMYNRFSIVYGAACMQLEKLDGNTTSE